MSFMAGLVVVEKGVHPSVPLVLQFGIAFICKSLFQTFSTLLVVIFPKSPSTAAAAGILRDACCRR